MDYDSGQGHYEAFPARDEAPGMAAGAQCEVFAEDGARAGWIAEQADETLVTYLPGGNRFGKSRSMLAALATIADLDEDGRREWQLAHDAQSGAAR